MREVYCGVVIGTVGLLPPARSCTVQVHDSGYDQTMLQLIVFHAVEGKANMVGLRLHADELVGKLCCGRRCRGESNERHMPLKTVTYKKLVLVCYSRSRRREHRRNEGETCWASRSNASIGGRIICDPRKLCWPNDDFIAYCDSVAV